MQFTSQAAAVCMQGFYCEREDLVSSDCGDKVLLPERGPFVTPGPSDPPEHSRIVNRDLRDGLYHVHAHLHAAVGVVGPGLRQPGHTIVTITQNFNT